MILTGALMWLLARSPVGYPVVVPYIAEAGILFIILGIATILYVIQSANLHLA